MRIISQNRCISVDFASVMIGIDENLIQVRTLNGATIDNKILGIYSTTERAKEVFEDIHNAYSPVYSVSDNLSEEEIQSFIGSQNVVAKNKILPQSDSGVCITTYDSFVYYMPEE